MSRDCDQRREAVLQRFGGDEDAALAPCEFERLLLDALRLSREAPPNERWTAGEHSTLLVGDLPDAIRAAAGGAYPMPTTMAEAVGELDYWRERELDMLACLGETYVGQSLDIVAEIRRKVLLEMSLSNRARKAPAVVRRIVGVLAADPAQSDRSIARSLGVSPTSVGKARSALSLPIAKRKVTRSGVGYEMAVRLRPAESRRILL